MGCQAMTIQIELSPELMERLVAEAEAQGILLEEYAERLLREAIGTHTGPQGQLSVSELHADRGGLGEVAEGANLGTHA